jgi:uncharacterized protein YyaL (SSP411 family)
MLYDNAQLARVHLHAWQVTGNEFFRTITEEILDYVIREMTHPAGGFYSTQDADSEGEEGKFFVWTPDEVREVLDEEADAFMAAYGVTHHDNFEGKNILEFVSDLDQRPSLAEARRKLFKSREQRVHPGRDENVLTSWNSLMLATLAEAARALDRDDYRMIAERNARFLLRELRQDNGRLLRTWKACPEGTEGTGEVKLNGYLEDYAYLMEGLIELYQTTFEPRWFVAAQELAETMMEHFPAPEGGFFDPSDDHEALITRTRDLHLRQCHAVGKCYGRHRLAEAGRVHQRAALCRKRSPGSRPDATHAGPVPAGLWAVAPGAVLCPFEAARDRHYR